MKWLKSFFCKLGQILTAIRRYTAHTLTFLVVLFLLIALFSGKDTVEVPKNSLLVLNPSGYLVEYEPELDGAQILAKAIKGEQDDTESVFKLVNILKHAQTDDRIQGLVLDLSTFNGGGIDKLETFRAAILDFKSSGKPVYTNADSYSQSQYLIASAADEIYLHPLGGVLLEGFRSETPYFGEALEKLNVKINIFRVGAYKSAVEPYLLSGMSDEARENLGIWLNEQWKQYLTSIQSHRSLDANITSGKLEDFMNALKVANYDMAQLAKNSGLVDGLKHRHEYVDYLIDKVGYNADKNSFNSIQYKQYWEHLPVEIQNPSISTLMAKNKIAVVMAVGEIVDGSGMPDQIGGDRLANELKKARFDDKVKAVVLRVDSPGGSAFASEVIRQEILELRKAGKPVIASMGSVAASGGYWISAGADKIIAAPGTITGSIGVFGMLPTIDEALAKIGIYFDGVGTTELPSGSITSKLTESTQVIIQSGVDAIYEDFLALVAEARGMSREAVHEIAQGQVWSGERAIKLGLVDELGDIHLAIEAAAELAELDKYTVAWPVVEKSFTQEILAEFGLGAQVKMPNMAALKKVATPLLFSLGYNDPKHIYVRCTECETSVNL